MRFMLHDFIEGGIARMVYKTGEHGRTITSRVLFLPGDVYEATDEKLIRLIKGEIGDVREKSLLTPQLKRELIANNIPYDVVKCGGCAGSKPKALYNPFKILEDE